MSAPTGFDARAWLDSHVNLELGVGAPRARPRGAPTLERITTLLTYLGTPQEEWPMVHITGTNGKTSVARMTARILGAAGLRVGTFTSPHLERLEERVAVDGEPIAGPDLDEMLYAVSLVERATGVDPSHFEIMVAAAYRWFADAAVDVAVVEVGLGGRWDATSAVEGEVAVVTNVGLDHTEWLGPTRADIAAEKAGIVVPGATLVLGETDPALLPIFEARSPDRLWWRDRDFGVRSNRPAVGGRAVDLFTPAAAYTDCFVALRGAHQGDNAAIAVAAAEASVGEALDEAVVAEGLAEVRSPGRLEIVGREPLVVLDGAHNPAGAATLASYLQDTNAGRLPIIIAAMADKDLPGMIGPLAPVASRFIATTVPNSRARSAEQLAGEIRVLAPTATVELATSPDAAVLSTLAQSPRAVAAGSLYLIGPLRATLIAGGATPRECAHAPAV